MLARFVVMESPQVFGERDQGRALDAHWDIGPAQLMQGSNALTPMASEKLVAGARLGVLRQSFPVIVPRSLSAPAGP